MPRLPPVTRTLRIVPRQLSGRRDVELIDEAEHRRHLVRGERGAAIGEDFTANGIAADSVAASGENDLGHHDAAGDRAFARSGPRHPHLGMAVDDRLDLLGMNLESPDIDDAAAPTDKIVAVPPQLDYVAGVDEAVAVS